jgi:hypothetical protein
MDGCLRVLGQIGVILNAKATHYAGKTPADELQVEDILEVEHDFIPVDGADAFQWRVIESIGDRVALAEAGVFRRVRISATLSFNLTRRIDSVMGMADKIMKSEHLASPVHSGRHVYRCFWFGKNSPPQHLQHAQWQRPCP